MTEKGLQDTNTTDVNNNVSIEQQPADASEISTGDAVVADGNKSIDIRNVYTNANGTENMAVSNHGYTNDFNWRGVWAVTIKDLKEIMRSKTALLPMLILPIIMFFAAPLFILLVCYNTVAETGNVSIIQYLPSGADVPAGLDGMPALAFIIFNSVYLPIYLVIPAMLSSVAGSLSFCSEREKKTLEGLMSTKLTALELTVSKGIAAAIPTIVCSLGTALIFGIIVDGFGYQLFNGMIFPSMKWIFVIFIDAPLVTLFMTLLTLFISQRASSVLTTQGISMLVSLPITAILSLTAVGSFSFKVQSLMILTLALIIGVALGTIIVSYTTDSEEMLLKGN